MRRNYVARLHMFNICFNKHDHSHYRHMIPKYPTQFIYMPCILHYGIIQLVFHPAVRQNLRPFPLRFRAVNVSRVIFCFDNEYAVLVDKYMIDLYGTSSPLKIVVVQNYPAVCLHHAMQDIGNMLFSRLSF